MLGIIGIILICGAVAAYFLSKYITRNNEELSRQLDKCTIKTVTPRGLTIYSSVNPFSSTIEAIDEVFEGSIEYYKKKYGFTKKLATKDYSIYLFPDVTELHGIPVFRVHISPGSEYDNSIYDQMPNEPGGFLYASELVIDPKRCEIAVAESHDGEQTAEAFRNGLEHVVLYHNDRKKYTATRIHLTGGHPLL